MSGNLGGADPHFEGDASIAPLGVNKGPEPTAENPGGVHPPGDMESDPHPPKQQGASIFHSIENPYALQEALNKLESSLDEIISMFQGEGNTLAKDGDFLKGKEGIKLFQGWKDELEKIKTNQI
ncbi:hypothetical protein CBS101457_003263 [Exobasidium rhododendri]|nr:hypothetical protein CBS101457_003263 [Exobasidium rhododendri]